MMMPTLECGGCFAPVKRGQTRCEFCGAFFAVEWDKIKWKTDELDVSIPDLSSMVQKGVVSDVGKCRIKPFADENFESSFTSDFEIKKQRYKTLIDIVIYENDSELASKGIIDAKKAGIENIANFLRATSSKELAFADLLETINDKYIKIITENTKKGETVTPIYWYNRDQHVKNIVNVFHETGFQRIVLWERKKKDYNGKVINECSFPAAHKMQYIANSIYDTAGKRFLKEGA